MLLTCFFKKVLPPSKIAPNRVERYAAAPALERPDPSLNSLSVFGSDCGCALEFAALAPHCLCVLLDASDHPANGTPNEPR
jgi:hypothetical protein